MHRAGLEHWSRAEVARLLSLIEGDRDYYRAIVDSLPVPLAILSPERTVMSANSAFRDILGFASDDLGRKTIDEILPAAPMLERLRDLQVHGISQPGFLVEHRQRTLRISLVPIRLGREAAESETMFIAELQQSRHSPDLSSSHVAPLHGSSTAMDARQDALRGISARLAHNLNNPLMVITGYAEELLEGVPAEDPRRAAAEQILAAAQRVGHLTGQLLDFTRSGAKPPQPVDANMVVSGLKPHLPGPPISVELSTQRSPLWVSADAGQLREILLTLASPAREDAQDRTRLKIGCEPVIVTATVTDIPVPPGRYAKIAVEDDGRGYGPEKSAVVFESFLAKEGEPTVGADLARAYAIVREWRGTITFSSHASQTARRGSVFHVYLPMSEPERAQGSPTILVVDDEPEIRTLVAKILRRENYNVLEASGALDALAAATRASSLDLLVTDVMLGERTGPELAAKLRAVRPDVKILYISGYSGTELTDSQPDAQYLQKPFTLHALLEKVRGLLER